MRKIQSITLIIITAIIFMHPNTCYAEDGESQTVVLTKQKKEL